MRAVVFAERGQVEVREVAEPSVPEGDVLVNVTRAGICGIDLKMWKGRIECTHAGCVPGHEIVGTTRDGRRVVVDPLTSCGMCAACMRGETNLCSRLRMPGMGGTQGWFAERVAVEKTQVFALDDALPDERAVMAEPLANVVHAFRLGAIQSAARLGIVGVGQMGAMALQMALRGGCDVLAVDVCAARVAIARSMGGSRAVHVDGAAGGDEARHYVGSGLDVVLDAAGTSEARQLAHSLCRPGGLVVMLGMAERTSAINFSAAIRCELRVQMSFGYTRRDFVDALDLLAAGAIDISTWTRTFAIADAQKAFDVADAKGDVLKVLLEMQA